MTTSVYFGTTNEQISGLFALTFDAAPGATYLATANLLTPIEVAQRLINATGATTTAILAAVIQANLGIPTTDTAATTTITAYLGANIASSGQGLLNFLTAATAVASPSNANYSAYGTYAANLIGTLQTGLSYSLVSTNTSTDFTVLEAAVANANSDVDSTYTITTDSYSWAGAAGDDTFNSAAGIIDGQTINGGAGTDILNLRVTAADDDGASFSMTNVETLNIRVSAATGDVTLDMADVAGIDLLNAYRLNNDLTLENLTDLDVTYQAKDISVDGIVLSLDFENSVISGTADTLNLAVDSVTATATTFALQIQDGIEAISLDVAGTNNVLSISGTGTLAVTSLDITGTGDISLSFVSGTSIVDVDASAYTGDLDITLSATEALSVLGGSGDDSINVSDLATASATNTSTIDAGAGDDTIEINAAAFNLEGVTIDGGAGTDTLTATLSATILATAAATIGTDTATVADISGIEKLHIDLSGYLDTAAAVVNLDLDALGLATAVDTVEITLGIVDIELNISNMIAEDLVLNLTDVGAVTVSAALTVTTGTADAISIAIDVNADNAAGTVDDANLTLKLSDFESISLDLNNNTRTSATAILDLQLGTAATSVVTAIDIVVGTDVSAAIDLSFATGLTTLDLSGAGDVTLTGVVDDVNIDASALTGDLTITSIAATDTDVSVSLTAGAGADDITIGDGRFTVDMGAGADTLAVDSDITRRDSLNGGAGTDTLEIAFGTLMANTAVVLNATNFEILNLTVAGGAFSATASVDSLTALTAIDANIATGSTLNINSIVGTEISIDITGALGDLTASAATTTDTNILNLTVSNTAATTGTIIGDLVFSGYDQINLDIDLNANTLGGGTITAASATSFVISAAAGDNLAQTAVITIDLADSATVDLTGIGGLIGAAAVTAAGTVTAGTLVSGLVGAVTGGSVTYAEVVMTGALKFNSTESVTVELGDGMAATGSDVVLNLGTTGSTTALINNTGADIIVFNDTSSDDIIGDVLIVGFNGRGTYGVSNATVLDLSDLGITEISELTFTDGTNQTTIGAATVGDGAYDYVTITVTGYTGTITLVGTSETDLTTANFIFA